MLGPIRVLEKSQQLFFSAHPILAKVPTTYTNFSHQKTHKFFSDLQHTRFYSTENKDADENATPKDDVDSLYSQLFESNDLPDTISAQNEALELSQYNGWLDMPVNGMINVIDSLHNVWGGSWWLGIVSTTILIRAIIYPLHGFSQANSKKMMNAGRETESFRAKMTSCNSKGDRLGAAQAKADLYNVYAKRGIRPWFPIAVALGQMPFLISTFVALRRLAAHEPGFETGGTLWFVDLSSYDPYGRLPAISCAFMLAGIHLPNDPGIASSKWFKGAMSAVSLIIIPITYYLPSATHLYFAGTSMLAFATTRSLRTQFCKGIFGIPSTMHDLQEQRTATASAQKQVLETIRNRDPTIALTNHKSKKNQN